MQTLVRNASGLPKDQTTLDGFSCLCESESKSASDEVRRHAVRQLQRHADDADAGAGGGGQLRRADLRRADDGRLR